MLAPRLLQSHRGVPDALIATAGRIKRHTTEAENVALRHALAMFDRPQLERPALRPATPAPAPTAAATARPQRHPPLPYLPGSLGAQAAPQAALLTPDPVVSYAQGKMEAAPLISPVNIEALLALMMDM